MPNADEPAEDAEPNDGPDPPWEATFIEQMARLREARGLSQAELAKRLKTAGLPFHQQTVQRIENGQRPVRLNEAFLIAQELESTIDSMTWSDELGIREVRDSVDKFRHAAASISSNLQDCLEHLSSEARDIVTRFTVSASKCERSGMETADQLTTWMAGWALRYLNLQSCLTDAFEYAAVAAGSAMLNVQDVEDTWPTLLPKPLEEADILEWMDSLGIDQQPLVDIPTDDLYRELNTINLQGTPKHAGSAPAANSVVAAKRAAILHELAKKAATIKEQEQAGADFDAVVSLPPGDATLEKAIQRLSRLLARKGVPLDVMKSIREGATGGDGRAVSD